MIDKDTGAILQAFYAAVNAKAIVQASQLLAENVCFSTPEGELVGRAEVCAYLQTLIKANVHFEICVTSTTPDTVYYAYRIHADGKLIDRGENGLAYLCDGLINFDGTIIPSEQEKQS